MKRLFPHVFFIIEIILWDGSGWIKGNAGQKGLYRVNYDDKNWEAFASALRKDHKVSSCLQSSIVAI